MKLPNIYKIASVLFFGISIFLLIRLKNTSSQVVRVNSSLETQILNNDNLNVVLSNTQQLQFANWFQSLQGLKNELIITSLEGEKIRFEKAVKDKKVIFHFASDMCSSCVEKEFENLKTLMEKYDKNQIIIFAQGYQISYLKRSEEFEFWRNEILAVKESIFNKGEIIYTPTITLMEDNEIKLVYHAPKNTNASFEYLIQAIE